MTSLYSCKLWDDRDDGGGDGGRRDADDDVNDDGYFDAGHF
jgi:hypothetical protein